MSNALVAQNNGDTAGFTTQEQLPCSWERELSKELAAYKTSVKGAYHPQRFCREQLSKAATEFYKRWKQSEKCFEKQHPETDEKSPFVWVSPSCSEIPSNELTASALEHLSDVDKLWYFLSDLGDLFIIKLASGPAHGAAVTKVTSRMNAYAEQYEQNGDAFDVVSDGILIMAGGGVATVGGRSGGRRARAAPDGVLQLTHPAHSNPPRMRSPLVIEVEIGNRGPKALMEQLDFYLQQPHSMYVLGIKIYKKQRTQGWANAAVAILWQRANAANAAHPVVGVWNFGTMALPGTAVTAFCRQTGGLGQPIRADFQYPPNNHTVTIPDDNLVQGAHYPNNGAPVQAAGNDLTIDLDVVLRKARRFMF